MKKERKITWNRKPRDTQNKLCPVSATLQPHIYQTAPTKWINRNRSSHSSGYFIVETRDFPLDFIATASTSSVTVLDFGWIYTEKKRNKGRWNEFIKKRVKKTINWSRIDVIMLIFREWEQRRRSGRVDMFDFDSTLGVNNGPLRNCWQSNMVSPFYYT